MLRGNHTNQTSLTHTNQPLRISTHSIYSQVTSPQIIHHAETSKLAIISYMIYPPPPKSNITIKKLKLASTNTHRTPNTQYHKRSILCSTRHSTHSSTKSLLLSKPQSNKNNSTQSTQLAFFHSCTLRRMRCGF
jgi:hypothetical protein